MIYREMLSNVRAQLFERRLMLVNELASCPQGQLNVRSQKGRHYYTLRIPREGRQKKIRRTSITGDHALITKLVRKRYLERAIRVIDQDIEIIDDALSKFLNSDVDSVLKDFFEKYPELRISAYPYCQSDRQWADAYDRQTDFYSEDLKSTDSSGTNMRSKGELIIAGRLDYYHIPFRYEAAVSDPLVRRIPDFTIRRPRDGKIIYWEHLGMTSDSGYMKRNALKLSEYESAGIVPWDNLIITYDKPDGGIDVQIIDAMIQGWLL